MLRRTLAIALVAAALTGLVGAPSAGACGGGPTAETFEVLTQWDKRTYSPGATVGVDVTVLRPGPRDPLGLGVDFEPPYQMPVENAYVVVAFAVGVPPVWGTGYTDAEGKVHLDIKLRPDLRGPIYSTTRASIMYNANGPDCTTVEEWGRLIEAPAFTIKKR
jgi:hypothetical protein